MSSPIKALMNSSTISKVRIVHRLPDPDSLATTQAEPHGIILATNSANKMRILKTAERGHYRGLSAAGHKECAWPYDHSARDYGPASRLHRALDSHWISGKCLHLCYSLHSAYCMLEVKPSPLSPLDNG